MTIKTFESSNLKPDQWNMIEELSQTLEPFEGVTVFLSEQEYVTLSANPQLVQKASAWKAWSLQFYQTYVTD